MYKWHNMTSPPRQSLYPPLSLTHSLYLSLSHCALQHGKQHAAPRRQATDTVVVAVAAADTDTTTASDTATDTLRLGKQRNNYLKA